MNKSLLIIVILIAFCCLTTGGYKRYIPSSFSSFSNTEEYNY